MKIALSIICFGLLAASLSADNYPDISIKELQQAILRGEVALIDVNGAKSYARGHIPTALEFSSSKAKLADLLPKNKDTLVVSYCGGPGCRAYRRGADAAAKLGFKNIKHLSAGISGWKRSGANVARK
ncbi:MAG: rhodanese-like domain-containing protein [Opitutales bacterium]|nr:rhodanese-like domain-containing protein [Opitutales bacterium]